MRKIATVPVQGLNAVRLMIYDSKKFGVFVFGYNTLEDAPCTWDCFFANIEDAYEFGEEYGIEPFQWTEIPDPKEGCQHDRIAQTDLQSLRKTGSS